MRGTWAVVALVLGVSGCSGAGDGPDRAAAPAPPADLSSAEVQSTWWTWSQSAPEAQDPVADPTGEHCALGQPDDLWLLAGTYGGQAERTCDVPAGRPVVAPAVNVVTPGRAGCESFLASAEGEVVVDGEDVALESWGPDPITVAGRSGESAGFACGLWAVVPELGPGEHTVLVTGASGAFSTRADYTLTVS